LANAVVIAKAPSLSNREYFAQKANLTTDEHGFKFKVILI